MSIIEYNTIMNKLMDIILEKTYSDELTWVSTINSNDSIKYETQLFLKGITITCILISPISVIDSIDIYIKFDDILMKIDWDVCKLSPNPKVEVKACELNIILKNRSNELVLKKLKNLIF